MDLPEAFPLKWPSGRLRLSPGQRKAATFGRHTDSGKRELSVADAVERIKREIAALGGRWPVISSNLELRRDGLPYSGRREPDDPGVAVYFQLAGKPVCMPCDRYTRVADNIAAIAAHIEATRAIERHGVGTAAEALMAFMALPAPGAARTWREVMALDHTAATRAQIDARYRELAKRRHPDAGGSADAMAELNRAREQAMKEIGP